MALPTLFNGSECGPSNPLRSLTKQFDANRGAQQDFFGSAYATTSQQSFRTQTSDGSTVQEATQFFTGERTVPTLYQKPLDPFHLDSLKINLTRVEYPVKPVAGPSLAMNHSSWSNDFLKQESQHVRSPETGLNSKEPLRQLTKAQFFSPLSFRQSFPASRMQQWLEPHFDARNETFKEPRASFLSEEYLNVEQAETAANKGIDIPIDPDELSRTAGLLIDAVKQESNPKFKNSTFLSLMRQLRDREMTIQGSEMVQVNSSEAKRSPIDVKGKGKATFADPSQDTRIGNLVADELYETSGLRLDNVGHSTVGPISTPSKQIPSVGRMNDSTPLNLEMETEEDRFWKEENDAYKKYWSHTLNHPGSYRHPEWGKLQEDWDKFEATSTGITAVSSYHFQAQNPYLHLNSLAGESVSHTRNEQPNESLLELEAAVQNDLRDPVRWFRLGVKQQENERERHAILALQRATELDPSYLEAWLALAISYTNEGDKFGSFNAIRNWLENHPKYKHNVSLSANSPDGERDAELTQQLMLLIRQMSEKEIDADLQTALGVVLNTSEGFERAQDCFRTALSVRPNDWLLYNRVGATLANSGRAKDAIWYYYQALALNPSYIRARFNLGIAYINMKQYHEAAQHILDALILQENDTSSGDTRGVTSSALWECLRSTCFQLQRSDLTVFCDERNLEGFRQAFSNG